MNIRSPLVVAVVVVIILLSVLIFTYTSRKDRSARTQRTGRPMPGAAQACMLIGFGIVTFGIFALMIGASNFAANWQTWYALRSATVVTQARVLNQQCVIPRGFAMNNDMLVTYQFEALSANGTRQLVTQKLFRDSGRQGCNASSLVLQNIAIRYDPQAPSISGLAPGPDIAGLIIGTVLGLVWLVLMSLLPIAAGLNTLLGLFDQHRNNPLQSTQEEQERRELEARGFMLLTNRELQWTVAQALQHESLAAAYVTQRAERTYLSFEFITDPSQRERAWDLIWRYQAGHALFGNERQEIKALEFEMLGESELAQSLRERSAKK